MNRALRVLGWWAATTTVALPSLAVLLGAAATWSWGDLPWVAPGTVAGVIALVWVLQLGPCVGAAQAAYALARPRTDRSWAGALGGAGLTAIVGLALAAALGVPSWARSPGAAAALGLATVFGTVAPRALPGLRPGAFARPPPT